MEKEILLNNKFVESSYIEKYKMAHLIWKKKYIPTDKYKEAFIVLLEYAQNNRVISFLSDGRLSGAVSTKNRKWFQNVAMNEADKVGLERVAMVIKAEPFRKYYINQIIKWGNKKNNYKLKAFTDYDKAFNWLINFEK